VEELSVFQTVRPRRRTYSQYPEAPEITLALLAISVRERKGAKHRLIRRLEKLPTPAAIALRHRENLIVAALFRH
jgi:hypothetical protein